MIQHPSHPILRDDRGCRQQWHFQSSLAVLLSHPRQYKNLLHLLRKDGRGFQDQETE
nr:hypothetical protein Iba_scaffold5767CG0580 [Ipomoea batatas]